MENKSKIIPPHLNSEVYRSDTTGTNTISNLDHLHVHTDGSMILGCSELTGRYWNGGACIFKAISEGEKMLKECKKHINLTSGTSDGCFVQNSNKVLLCEDNGAVSIWSAGDNDVWKTWNLEMLVTEHDDAVMAVDNLNSETEYVTVGGDGYIKIWDVTDMICIRNYISAHSMAISGVAVKPKCLNTFVTASLDQYISMWADNVTKPVLDIIKNDCGIRCVQWLNENCLVFGDEAGVLKLVDIRNTENVLELGTFPAAVHKLTVHSDSRKVAVCCDNRIVSVCDVSESGQANIIYQDRGMHSNYVRSAIWDPNEKYYLHTVGWDGEIKTHRNICCEGDLSINHL